MCQIERFPSVYPDGRKVKPTKKQTTLCQYARGNSPCGNQPVYSHPLQTVSYSSTSTPNSSPHFNQNLFPPTPNYTPRSSTPNYRSGDESDRSGSYRSGSSSSRQRARRMSTQAPNVFVNGQRVYSSNNGERIVLVNGPPTPRTPPQNHTFPNTAPPSPVAPYVVDASPRRQSRPVIVDDRPVIDVDFGAARRTHVRNSSSSSYSTQDEESSSSRRRRREAEKAERREAERRVSFQSRMAAANAAIASRPEVAPGRRPNPAYHQPELVDEFDRMNLREGQRREKREQEAQDQRLRERMQPTRRATVGHGGRRPRVHYQEGQVRWE